MKSVLRLFIFAIAIGSSHLAAAQCGSSPTMGTVQAPTDITENSARLEANHTSDGGANCEIISTGFVWDTQSRMNLGGYANSVDGDPSEGNGPFSFSAELTGLPSGTRIYYRAFIRNNHNNANQGTRSSNELSFYTLAVAPAEHAASLTATALDNREIQLTFPAAGDIANADGYVVLMRAGADPTTAGLINGAVPDGADDFVYRVNSTSATSLLVSNLDAGTTYHFTIIPYNREGFTNETYHYLTSPGSPVASATTEPEVVITALGTIASSPLGSGTENVPLIGFSLESTGDVTFERLVINLSSTTSGKFSNFRFVESSDVNYDVSDSPVPGAALNVQSSSIEILLSELLSASDTRYFFLVADVEASVNGTTPSVTLSFDEDDLTFDPNNKRPGGQSRNYSFADTTPPVLLSFTPANGSVIDINTAKLIMTFNENVDNITTAATSNAHRVVIYDATTNTSVAQIDRNAVVANGTSPVAEVNIPPGVLKAHSSYYVLVGNGVIEDVPADNDWPGISDPSVWTFSTSGVVVTGPSASICSGTFEAIGDIVISETGNGDFNEGNNVTLILGLENPAEFALSNAGIVVNTTGSDISNVSVSAGLTTLTLTYTINGTSDLDAITIQGLKVYGTGNAATTTLRRVGGTASQDGNDGVNASSHTYATIDVGAVPPPQPALAPAQTFSYCEGEDLSTATLALIDNGADEYRWYSDAGLNTLRVATPNETVNLVTDLGMTAAATVGTHRFYVVAVASCQSAPPLEVVVTVTNNPVADAGLDKTGADAVCPGTEITLGGNPTLQTPSSPGGYTYDWDYIEGTTEPASQANPKYTVNNSSTTTSNFYNFEVVITDANGCSGSDQVTVEVKPTFSVFLTSPSSTIFTPSSPNQNLSATPAGGTFTGIGVVQSGASTFQFSPSVAHNTDPNTLPKSFNVYYTVTQNGCTRENFHVATFTISNSFFATLESEYCSNEYPSPTTAGVQLSLDQNGYDYMEAFETSWNTFERYSRANVPTWQLSLGYGQGVYVLYGNDFYQCTQSLGCTGVIPPDSDPQWVQVDLLKVKFTGRIANYYEYAYGGNSLGATIVKLGTTYSVGGKTFPYYQMGTNVSYNDCDACQYAYPAAYLDLERPEDVHLLLSEWNPGYYYYRHDLVRFGKRVYRCIPSIITPAGDPVSGNPAANPGLWEDVTNSNFANGQYFHLEESPGVFRAGFYVRGQHVQINRNPTVFFNGLVNGEDVCQFEVLDLDNQAASAGNEYNLIGSLSNLNYVQDFQMRRSGSEPFSDGGGAIQNSLFQPGHATFNTNLAFGTGNETQKSVEIRYRVHPGTTGSAGQPCYGTSTITVDIIKNSNFSFHPSVQDDAVFCYLDEPKELRAVNANGNDIIGQINQPNSVSYSGHGVINLTQSRGSFRPGIAIDEQSPGTRTQQTVIVTATYLDQNRCRSMTTKTLKVNPDIKPSFSLNGRVTYCYEDIANNFIGHSENFTVGGNPVSSTGHYQIFYRDPSGTPHRLDSIPSTNIAFIPGGFYDQTQQILTNESYPTELNKSVTLDVVYWETLTTNDTVCTESTTVPITINPAVALDIFGLNNGDILCRNDNNLLSQGNTVTFDGSVTGAGVFSLDDDPDFTAVNPTLNATVNTVAGKATINLLEAYNAASDPTDPRQVYLEYRYTAPGCTGPSTVVKGFHISPPPPIAFDFAESPAANSIFCNDAEIAELKTVQNTNVTITGFGITDSGTGNGTALFNPALAYSTSMNNGGTINTRQDITVTARIIDGIGCANTANVVYSVNPIPTATVDFSKKQFCYEDAPATFQGLQSNSWFQIEYLGVTTPYSEDFGGPGSPQPQVTFNPTARFDHAISMGASTLTPVDFNVYYTAADANGCTHTVGPTLVSVANRIEVQIAGITEEDNIYCSNRNNGSTILTFNPFPSDNTKREFSINGDEQSLTINRFDFRPPLHGGDFTLEYVVYSGENNCSNTETVQVKVLPSPKAVFTTEPACEDDLIEFSADGSQNLDDLNPVYTWTLADATAIGQTVHHRFTGTNLFGVNLKVEYPAYLNNPALVCKDSLRLDQVVGANPTDLRFKFSSICEDDETQLEITPDIPISRVSWDFGDGVTTPLGFSADLITGIDRTTGEYQRPRHTFSGAGQYRIVVTGKTADVFGGCERVEEHYISILPNWAPNPSQPYYDMASISGGSGGWVPEHDLTNPTWDFAPAVKSRILAPEPAWITSSSTPYKPGDASYVNSPCFDLSSFSRPVISLNHWTDTEPSDGAVLQYSTDGGTTWNRLGDVASGLEWYNKLTIAANPGDQTNLSSGWSTADQEDWVIGKHSLDGIHPRNKVRFRIAFASFNNPEGRDGFAFNNVLIEERNRTVLVENFTHLNQNTNNLLFKGFKAIDPDDGSINPLELVKLQYHHSPAVPNVVPDVLHDANPIDHDARAAFYGITNTARAFIDGGFGQSSTNATFTSPDVDTYFSLRSLVTSPVNISLSFENQPSDRLNVKATVKANMALDDPHKYNVFIAVAEREVLGQVYVLRKFLPSAAGVPLGVSSPADPEQEITVSYDMRHVTRLIDGTFAPFAVIAFVQHLETKSVLQTVMREDATASSDIVTGVDPSSEAHVRFFPNPADDVLHIEFESAVAEGTKLTMFDTWGRQVFGTEVNSSSISIPTKDLSGGVYIVELDTPKGKVRRKIMVLHD